VFSFVTFPLAYCFSLSVHAITWRQCAVPAKRLAQHIASSLHPLTCCMHDSQHACMLKVEIFNTHCI